MRVPISTTWRSTALARLADETFDVLVVGAGATGAAIARDASVRGLRVALCDHGDFAGQTSSQSSKLIHGGLRYLQYGDLPLVFEGLAERRILMATAPHLCRPIEFLFPAYRDSRPSLAALGLGVGLYRALALGRSPGKSRRVDASHIYDLAPQLRSAGLVGAEIYVDCQTDDARLVLENVLDAESAGAVAASYVEIRLPDPGAPRTSIRIAHAVDRETGDAFAIRCRAIVSAAGPFGDALAADRSPPVLRPTLGVHVVFDANRLPTGGRAIVIRGPRDGRLIFTLPAGARTIVGTTDTDWSPPDRQGGPRPTDEIRARGVDVDYLLEAVNAAFPPAALGRADVLSTFAGLRPLIAAGSRTTSATSREHDVSVDHTGVLTVTGGKLTTMRKMAQEAVDRLANLLRDRGHDAPIDACTTRTRPLPGGGDPPDLTGRGLAPDVEAHLLAAYGARAAQVIAMTAEDASLSLRIIAGLPYIRAEIAFAARVDRAVEIEDVLRRRIPIFRDSPDQGLAVAEDTADVLTAALGWSAARRARSLDGYRSAVASSGRWRTE